VPVTRLHAILLFASLMLVMLITAAQFASGAPSVPSNALAAKAAAADSTLANARPGPVAVRGTLSDANGSPIRGATINLMSETDTVRVYSNAEGKFHARLTATRGVSMVVQAYGYRNLYRSFRASGHGIDAALALPPPYPLGGAIITAAPPLLHAPSSINKDQLPA
jgi:hypothetical protein